LHHFEVQSAELVGDDFQIVLRNSITGHQMTLIGSTLGVSMKHGQRIGDVHVQRLAANMAKVVGRAGTEKAVDRAERLVKSAGAISSRSNKRMPADLRLEVDRRVRAASKTAETAIKRAQTQIAMASSNADVKRVLKRLDQLTKQAQQVARGSVSVTGSITRRSSSTSPRTTKQKEKQPSRKPAERRNIRGATSGKGRSNRRRSG
jgi:hypothetical protein